jgi:threonine synthase
MYVQGFSLMCPDYLLRISSWRCNENDVFSDYLSSGSFRPKTAVPTISNAMDVGNPSNFVRILELFGHDHARISALISSYSISDRSTSETIAEVYRQYHYLLDPHGAVAYRCAA